MGINQTVLAFLRTLLDVPGTSDIFRNPHCAHGQPHSVAVSWADGILGGTGVWIEVSTLFVPAMNDSAEEMRQIAEFAAGLSADIPWQDPLRKHGP